MTLVKMLERNAIDIPEKTSIIYSDFKMNYKELNDTVNKLANTLLAKGLKKGDRIGIILPRIPELIISFLAVAKAEGIAAPVNFELTNKDIKEILKTLSPKYLIVHSLFFDLAKSSVLDDSQTEIIEISNIDNESPVWEKIMKEGNANNPGLDIKEDHTAYLNYTSGSSGNPKGAVTTHANIYWNTIASVEALGLKHEDVHLCMFAPFAHPHEIFARSLLLGGTIVLVDKLYPKSLAEAISKHRVTCMMGLSPMYENLLQMLEHKKYDLSCLRIPESGGMFTRTKLIEKFKEKIGVPIIPVWGSTETTGIAIANRPGETMRSGSVGKLCKTYEIKIVDEDDTELPPGEIGEMIFRGPAVVKGYYNDDDSGQKCFKNGWYYSGDLGEKDEQENFYFVERKTGMIKAAGLKVYPLEIEVVLMDHPNIKEVAVVSVRDRLRGEVPKAIVVAKNGVGFMEKEVIEFCKKRMPQYKLPRIVEIRKSLPKSGSGKINKKALQMEYV